MHRWATAAIALALLPGCADSGRLGRDEQVVLFPTAGYRLEGGDQWILPIHGWVYRDSWFVRNIGLVRHIVHVDDFVESATERENLRRRLTPFLVDNREGRRLRVAVGEQSVRLKPSAENGHFQESLCVPAAHLDRLNGDGAKSVQYRIVTDDARECLGTVHLLEQRGLTIVSDIDDTIRITEVNNTKKMVKNTFLRPFTAVPGMAAVYNAWAREFDAQFIYLSSSPAQLSDTMSEFLESSQFPPGAMYLRAITWEGSILKDMLELLSAPPEYKLAELVWLMQALPEREYVLIGDSGQDDPEIYAAIARAFPGQVQRILIRDVTCCEGRDSHRYLTAFRGLPDSLWVLFREPASLIEEVDGPYQERTRDVKPHEPLWRDVFIHNVAAYN